AAGTFASSQQIITPIFDAEGKEIIFWAISRGHHADVGGIFPGFMSPNSEFLCEEGAVFDSFMLLRDGIFAKELKRLLCDEPKEILGNSSPCCFQDKVTYIKAQVEANHNRVFVAAPFRRIPTHRLSQAYMGAIEDSAELAVHNLIRKLAVMFEGRELSAIDCMDNRTAIKLKVTINPEDRSAIFGFIGTGSEFYGNWNAPVAICKSTAIYALRITDPESL
ncbi:hypothetical protein GQ53DRAFT_632925, partial [Thozetella sp. PMI_491]